MLTAHKIIHSITFQWIAGLRPLQEASGVALQLIKAVAAHHLVGIDAFMTQFG
jgi:hypothetical protein